MAHYRGIDYMRWFLRHADELEPLLSRPDQLRAASGLEGRWDLLRESLDTVVRIVADAPLVRTACAVSPDEVKAMHVELEAKDLQWERVARLVPLLIDLIELLRGMGATHILPEARFERRESVRLATMGNFRKNRRLARFGG